MDAFIEMLTAQGPAWLHSLDVVDIFRGIVIGIIVAVGIAAQWQASREMKG